jgi:hypothetical protein
MIVVVSMLFLILLGMAKSEQKNARFRKAKRDYLGQKKKYL